MDHATGVAFDVLIPARVHDGIRSGSITVAFRAWKRPSVVAGGTLLSPAGLLGIDEVTPIALDDVTDRDARSSGAGAASEVRAELERGLARGDGRRCYRIRFHRIGDDPRIALRRSADLSDEEWAAIDARLARWDRAAGEGPWTRRLLEVIERHPGIVSTELAAEVSMDRPDFKRRVRQLKGLGLTESLDVGYRLSPRGAALLARSIPPSSSDSARARARGI